MTCGELIDSLYITGIWDEQNKEYVLPSEESLPIEIQQRIKNMYFNLSESEWVSEWENIMMDYMEHPATSAYDEDKVQISWILLKTWTAIKLWDKMHKKNI